MRVNAADSEKISNSQNAATAFIRYAELRAKNNGLAPHAVKTYIEAVLNSLKALHATMTRHEGLRLIASIDTPSVSSKGFSIRLKIDNWGEISKFPLSHLITYRVADNTIEINRLKELSNFAPEKLKLAEAFELELEDIAKTFRTQFSTSAFTLIRHETATVRATQKKRIDSMSVNNYGPIGEMTASLISAFESMVADDNSSKRLPVSARPTLDMKFFLPGKDYGGKLRVLG